jgi:hypothetical protein
MTRTMLMLTALLLISAWTFAQAQRGTEQASPSADQIKLTLLPSRAQTASDTSFAISAEIENPTTHPIFISPTFLTLTIPPEVDPAPNVGNISEWYAFLPGTGETGENSSNQIVAVGPGSRTTAIFSLARNPSFAERFKAAVRLVPGDYRMHVVCAYWKTFEDAKQHLPNYSIQTAETTLTVIAPPSAILTGAALGGLMAFFLLPNLWLPVSKKFEEHRWPWRVFIVCRGLAASSLLSVIVTILLSRVSESQFLIRVSIQDFWGAVAIGFIVGASGTSILQRWNLSQARQESVPVTATPTNPEEKKIQTTNGTEADASASAAHAA